MGRRKGVQIARTKKKELRRCQKRFRQENGEKKRERQCNSIFFFSFYGVHSRGFYISLERCIRRCCVQYEQRPGRDRFYALLRLSAGSSPNCRVKRKEKGFYCVPLHVQPLDAPLFTVTGEGSFLFLRPRASAATKKIARRVTLRVSSLPSFSSFAKRQKFLRWQQSHQFVAHAYAKEGRFFLFLGLAPRSFAEKPSVHTFPAVPRRRCKKGNRCTYAHIRTGCVNAFCIFCSRARRARKQ